MVVGRVRLIATVLLDRIVKTVYNTVMLPVVQGQIGLVNAIKDLTQVGYVVSLPIIDNQDYALVVEINNKLCKVQVKSSSAYSKANSLIVQIKRVRANKTKNNIYNFDNTKVDYVYIYEINGRRWFIPAKDIIAKSSLTMTNKLDKYKMES